MECSMFAMVTSCVPCRWRHISVRRLMVAGLATVMRSISVMIMGSWCRCKCGGLEMWAQFIRFMLS
jgi:hypothetical protein